MGNADQTDKGAGKKVKAAQQRIAACDRSGRRVGRRLICRFHLGVVLKYRGVRVGVGSTEKRVIGTKSFRGEADGKEEDHEISQLDRNTNSSQILGFLS